MPLGRDVMDNREIRIAGVIRESIVDGPGFRFVVFAQGCPHSCEGCHNPSTHDFSAGYFCSVDKIMEEVDKNPLLSGLTFSGGEPFCQPQSFLELAKEVKKRKNLNLVCYTGYTLEELRGSSNKNPAIGDLLDIVDYLIDGKFILEEKNLTLPFRGSNNQRVIDMKASKEAGILVLKEFS